WMHWWIIERDRVRNPTYARQQQDHWGYTVLEVLHAILPRYKDLDWLTARAIKAELLRPTDPANETQAANYRRQVEELDKEFGSYTWGGAPGASGAFIVVLVGLAAWRFAGKDY